LRYPIGALASVKPLKDTLPIWAATAAESRFQLAGLEPSCHSSLQNKELKTCTPLDFITGAQVATFGYSDSYGQSPLEWFRSGDWSPEGLGFRKFLSSG